MTTTLTRRRVNPVTLTEAVVISKPVCCCEMLPKGIPGLVRINGQVYTLTYNATLPEVGEPVVHGYKMASTESLKSYDLPADLWDCTCPDHCFRRNTPAHPQCKHQLAVAAFREAGKIV